jgi:hypothetical protein
LECITNKRKSINTQKYIENDNMNENTVVENEFEKIKINNQVSTFECITNRRKSINTLKNIENANENENTVVENEFEEI